ncbi:MULTISPECIES: DUF3775 domain-containing protein [Ectothiorhodospira]|jgi:hypothetical protein|uniref:DUF3775 domain-containing protein n=1 Tax=Ectothiorhodospira marina TaxID=1396821 RepID=A0A1H7J089_9GAMM|nr:MULTISPECIES: DUF3775 domain-containing protein [Ectothiorhodospira]MCG5515493.1 DUF3775 domain-containing protein [Ectothiorhodospira sp. 9100]MCG5518134.1 DUF3775 domain-containing protein [Ectothiorhodospira sp. 9905]SEK68046.1 Protein of unknown function [Ectothiorhodospira marina]
MLQISPNLVCWFISHAREFHAQEDVMLPEEPDHQTDAWIDEALEEHADNAVYLDLKNAVEELEPELQANMVALMWLGRGDYSDDEWDLALEEAKSNWTPRTADYLLATPMGADYLAEGLAMLGHTCEDD